MNEFDEVEYIMDKVAMEDRDFADFIDFVEDVCNENEQLKQREQTLLDEIEDFQELLKKLDNENEQLKKDLKKEFIPFARADEDGITKVDTDTFIRILQENEQLKKRNQGLQFKIIDILDFVKEKGTVTRQEMKEWWNNEIKGGM